MHNQPVLFILSRLRDLLMHKLPSFYMIVQSPTSKTDSIQDLTKTKKYKIRQTKIQCEMQRKSRQLQTVLSDARKACFKKTRGLKMIFDLA